MLVVSPTRAAVTIEVRPATTYQSVEGIGGGIVYYLDWVAKHAKCEELYDTVFSGLGLSALRMGNWAQEPDADLSLDSAIYAAAKKRLGDNFYLNLTSWSAPASLKSNNDLLAGDDKVDVSLAKKNGQFVYNEFGSWWKRSLEQYRAVGIYPDYVCLQNEVDCNPGYYGMMLNPTETYSIASYPKCLSAAAREIKSLPNPPKIIGPEVIGIGWNDVQKYLQESDCSLLDVYSFHYYHSGKEEHKDTEIRYSFPDDFKDEMQNLYSTYSKENKPLFMTENSPLRTPTEMDPLYTAWFLSLAFTVNHVNSYTHWNLIWGDSGDACINIDTLFVDGKYQKIDGGYRVNGDYHALRHFSKFVKRGWQLCYATTTDNDVLITFFKSPKDDGYAMILVNKSKYDKSLDCSFNPEGFRASVWQSVVPKSWSVNLGTFDEVGELALPGNSITTISYRPKVDRYIFESDTACVWSNPLAWSPEGVPSSSDSVFISRGLVFSSDLTMEAPLSMEMNGAIGLRGVNRMRKIISNGGLFKSDTDVSLTVDSFVVNELTKFEISSPDTTSRFELQGSLMGEGIVNRYGTDTLILDLDGSGYDGSWVFSGGYSRVVNSTSLGTHRVDVVLGTLCVDSDMTIQQLYVGADARLHLNAMLEVKSVRLGPDTLYGGVYTASDFPDFLTGDCQLFVNLPRPVLTRVISSDTVSFTTDDSIPPLVFQWDNANSVDVSWNPIQPKGINVTIDDSVRSVTFSGKSDTVGTFVYTVSTVGMYGPVASDSGRFIFKPAPGHVLSENISDNELSISYSNGLIHLSTSVQLNCYAVIADMSGRVVGGNHVELSVGDNAFSLGALNPGAYLLQIRGKDIYKTFKFVVD